MQHLKQRSTKDNIQEPKINQLPSNFSNTRLIELLLNNNNKQTLIKNQVIIENETYQNLDQNLEYEECKLPQESYKINTISEVDEEYDTSTDNKLLSDIASTAVLSEKLSSKKLSKTKQMLLSIVKQLNFDSLECSKEEDFEALFKLILNEHETKKVDKEILITDFIAFIHTINQNYKNLELLDAEEFLKEILFKSDKYGNERLYQDLLIIIKYTLANLDESKFIGKQNANIEQDYKNFKDTCSKISMLSKVEQSFLKYIKGYHTIVNRDLSRYLNNKELSHSAIIKEFLPSLSCNVLKIIAECETEFTTKFSNLDCKFVEIFLPFLRDIKSHSKDFNEFKRFMQFQADDSFNGKMNYCNLILEYCNQIVQDIQKEITKCTENLRNNLEAYPEVANKISQKIELLSMNVIIDVLNNPKYNELISEFDSEFRNILDISRLKKGYKNIQEDKKTLESKLQNYTILKPENILQLKNIQENANSFGKILNVTKEFANKFECQSKITQQKYSQENPQKLQDYIEPNYLDPSTKTHFKTPQRTI